MKKEGDIVAIFEKPLSDEGYEGTAKLIKCLESRYLGSDIILDRWLVEFVSDHFICERLISYEVQNETL